MRRPRVAILTCHNTTQDRYCSSYDETVAPEAGAKMFQQIIGPSLGASPARTMADAARMLYPGRFAPRPAACAVPPAMPGPAAPTHAHQGGSQ